MRRSDAIGQLGTALALAQLQIKGAVKDALNPHFKSRYADLASVSEACREALAQNGLAVAQGPRAEDGGALFLETVLIHQSGEWLAADVPLYFDTEGRTAMQSLGSAISYARRYGLAALVGVVAEDDDGGAAGPPPRPAAAREPDRPPNGHAPAPPAEDWRSYLRSLLGAWQKFEPLDPADDKGEVAREHRIAQHLAGVMVQAKLIAESDLLKPAEAGKAPARDARKVFDCVKRAYAEHPDWVRIQCRSYLIAKRDEARLQAQPAAAAPVREPGEDDDR